MNPDTFPSRSAWAGLRRCTAAGATLLAVAAAAPAQQQAEPATAVITVVKVPRPWYAPKSVVVARMRDTVAQYDHLPGLAFKAFSFARESGDYGGLYYWRDLASAQAWFTPAWFERVRKERGAEADVRYLDAPLSIDNSPGGTPLSTASSAVATLVDIPVPAGVSRERLVAEFGAAVPVYQNVPGLLRKHFTVSDRGSFGGLYIWKDEASAKAWFTPAWHERVRGRYGADARIEWFDTPILLPSQRADNAPSAAALVVTRP